MGRPLREVGNEGNPNKLGVFSQSVKMGSALQLTAATVSATGFTDILVLPENAKATAVVSAFVTAGTTTGAKTPVIGAPATTQVAVNEDGDILFNVATDEVTAAEVVYTTVEGSIVESAGIVVSGALLLPNSDKARVIISATVDGNARTVLARAAAPSAGETSVSLLGTTILFNAADDGGSAVVRYVQFPTVSVSDALVADVDF